MKTKIPKSLIIAAFSFALSSWVGASTLMLNFKNSSDNGVPSGYLTNSPLHSAVPSFTDTTWNSVSTTDVGSGLLWSDGTSASGISLNTGIANSDSVTRNSATTGGSPIPATTVRLDLTPSGSNALGNTVNTGVYAPNPASQTNKATSAGTSGIWHGSGAETYLGAGLQVSGLSAGTYDIYITSRNTNAGPASPEYTFSSATGTGIVGSNFDFSGYASQSITVSTDSEDPDFSVSAWVESGDSHANYMKFRIELGDGEALNIASMGSSRGFLNSVQISAVPEPSTYALALGLGCLSLAYFRRRQHR